MACPKCGCKECYQYDDEDNLDDPWWERCAACGNIFYVEDHTAEDDDMTTDGRPALPGQVPPTVTPLVERLREGTFYNVQDLMDEAAMVIDDMRETLRMVDDNNRVDDGEARKSWRHDFVVAEVRRVLRYL